MCCCLAFLAALLAGTRPLAATTWSWGDTAAKGSGVSAPHSGVATSGDCSVCHLDGADPYDLVRQDRPDDACIYCHVGSTHSLLQTYDRSPYGVCTPNGHTLGADARIPGSSRRQMAEDLSLTGADGDDRVVKVRRYEEDPLVLYRFARAQGAAGRFLRVGPTSLGCVSCHEPHGDREEVWRPKAFSPSGEQTAFLGEGYKLLRRYPSGSVNGEPAADGTYGEEQLVKAIEDDAADGVNHSPARSCETTYVENGTTSSQPVWVSQAFDSDRRPVAEVNAAALSWWCADCHNLMVGNIQDAGSSRMHGDRTHPTPFVGAADGPGQCYSCHRSDLSPEMGDDQPAATADGEKCTRCHYGTYDYAQERFSSRMGMDDVVTDSDFPHSGGSDDYKLLGAFAADDDGALVHARIGPHNLDAVCMRCHSSVGEHS